MDYKRADGRLPNELRDIAATFDGLSGVDGSARFGFGETKALSSVSGPIEVRLAAEQASKATFEVAVRPLAGLPGTESKALASALRSVLLPSMILTNNPRTLVQLVAQALASAHPSMPRGYGSPGSPPPRASPALVAAVINASSLALLNSASIPLRGVVCSAAVGRVRSTHTLLADPGEDELAALDGSGAFAFLVSGGKAGSGAAQAHVHAELVWSGWSAAPFDEGELTRATELARAGALCVWERMKEAVGRAAHGSASAEISAPKTKEVDAIEVLDDAAMEIS
ncbi:hypothetical protein M0805_005451 [Coniferiporia weirii]|nr:hypothetical protein M0805_005451 [Coniferiporia weirii]